MLLGLLWANNAYAINFGKIWEYMGFKEVTISDDSINVAVATSQPIIPKHNLNKILPTSKRIILPLDYDSRTAGQCVSYVKYITGVEYNGNAIEWNGYINSEKPEVGSIVVMQVGRWGHLGIVIEIKGDKIVVRSRNWMKLWQISDDEFDINDIRILGYIRY